MLSFQHIQTNGRIPANSFTEISGKLYLDIGTFIGETGVTLSSPKVAEFIVKLHLAGFAAQTVYNLTAPLGQRLNIFTTPVSGSNQYFENLSPPGYYSSMQCTCQGLIPGNIDGVIAAIE